MKKISLIGLLLVIFHLAIRQVLAQNIPAQQLTISPIIQQVQLQPGDTNTSEIVVENTSDQEISVTLSVKIFTQNETDGNIEFLPDASELAWMDLSNVTLNVPARSKKSVRVSISPPKEASEGGYYFAVLFSPKSFANTSSSTQIQTDIAALLFTTIGTINEDALKNQVTIRNFQPTRFVNLLTLPKLTWKVENSNLIHVNAKPRISEHDVEEKKILPSKSRVWSEQLTADTIPWWSVWNQQELRVSIGAGIELIAKTSFIYISKLFLLLFVSATLFLVLVMKIFAKIKMKKTVLENTTVDNKGKKME